MRCLLVTHPEVVVDARVPVPQWPLSEVGRERARAFAASLVGQGFERVVSSRERKAAETGQIIGAALSLSSHGAEDLRENNRSATGFLPPEEFELTADEFFSRPHVSVRGWETAVDAQRRIVSAVRRISDESPGRRIVVVAHGAVGSLLLADLRGVGISRALDQPRQGCWFAFDPEAWTAEGGWTPIAGTARAE